MAATRLVRIRGALALTGMSKSKLYDSINAGLMPAGVNIGGRSVAWVETELAAVNSARIRGESDEAVRELVRRLVVARQAAA